jgi:hypothetical protein
MTRASCLGCDTALAMFPAYSVVFFFLREKEDSVCACVCVCVCLNVNDPGYNKCEIGEKTTSSL